jgi:hypothetical protein
VEISLPGKNNISIPYLWTVLSSDNKKFKFYGYYLGPTKDLETRYERIYSSTTDAITLISTERYTDCNQAALNLFKIKSVEEFTKYHPADLSPPFQPDGESSHIKADRMIDKAIKEGRTFFEWTHRNSEALRNSFKPFRTQWDILSSGLCARYQQPGQAAKRDRGRQNRANQLLQAYFLR